MEETDNKQLVVQSAKKFEEVWSQSMGCKADSAKKPPQAAKLGMDSSSSQEQQDENLGGQIKQVSSTNEQEGSAPISGGNRHEARGESMTVDEHKTLASMEQVDSGAAQLSHEESIGGGGDNDVEMSSSSTSSAQVPCAGPTSAEVTPAAISSSTLTSETETAATDQQPPAGAMPAGIPGLPPGMPMDPFALLVQMSDRLIDESYQASSKDGSTSKRQRPQSGAECGAGDGETEVSEPHSKVQKREELAAEPSSSSKHRRIYVNDFTRTPIKIAESWGEFNNKHKDNFLKGCKWSPDGTCILTCSNDNCLRIFNLPEELYYGKITSIPEMCAVLQMQEGECIYDYDWFPTMSSREPSTCCLVSTSRDTPVHMWDAFTGEMRCSYRAFDQMDELAPAYSLSFNPEGTKLFCGFNKAVRIFEVSRPGRDCVTRPTYNKQDHVGQTGIISCIAFNPCNTGLYAAGSYSRSVGVYSEPEGVATCVFQGQQGGVTHIMFSPDGNRLYSGGRKDPEILCWDLRNPGQILHTMMRQVATNQRIYFDIDSSGRYVLSGSHDGSVLVWDTNEEPQPSEDSSEPFLHPILPYKAHEDTVNGISLHPSLPILATASGQRHIEVEGMEADSDKEEEEDEGEEEGDNSLRLWWIGK